MRFERLELWDGETVALSFHPRLTVVTAIGSVERLALADTLLAALGPGGSDLQLEVVERSGRALTIVRPGAAGHHVIDARAGRDITAEFRSGRTIDVLHAYGLEAEQVRSSCYLDGAALRAQDAHARTVRTLAAVDQLELWAAAAWRRASDDQVRDELLEQPDPPPTAPSALDAVSGERLSGRGTRWGPDFGAALLAVAVLVVAVLVAIIDPIDNAPALAGAVLVAVAALLFRSMFTFDAPAGTAEAAPTGARHPSSSGTPTPTSSARRWADVAGDVSVTWALEHHDEILAAAAREDDLDPATSSPDLAFGLAFGLACHLDRLQQLDQRDEDLPLILDEPFLGAGQQDTAAALALLLQRAGEPQIILLTDDDDIAAWARVAAPPEDIAVTGPVRPAPQGANNRQSTAP